MSVFSEDSEAAADESTTSDNSISAIETGRERFHEAVRGHRILATFIAFELVLFVGGWLLDALTGPVDNKVLTNEIFPVLSGIMGAAGIAFGLVGAVIYLGWAAYSAKKAYTRRDREDTAI